MRLALRSLRWLGGAGLLAGLASASCYLAPQREGDGPWRSGTQLHHADGTLRRARLLEPMELDGICCTGWVWFHPNGRVASADLARDRAFACGLVPAESRVFFDERGALTGAFLCRDTTLGGVPCKGGAFKSHTAFHPDGRVKATFLRRNLELEGVPCAASSQVPVRFDERGRLIGCKLSRDVEIAGVPFRAGTTIELLPDGSARALD